jgi:hypothetical protein
LLYELPWSGPVARGEISGRKPRVSADPVQRRRRPPATDDGHYAEDADDDVNGDHTDEDIEATPRGEPNSRSTLKRPSISGPPTPAAAYSIAAFCVAHDISESFYFKLREQGLGPREMRVGARVLISLESAERWRRERESTTNT